MTRDLKADLEGLRLIKSEWTELPRGIVDEYLERAIAAEELADKLSDELVKTIEKCAPEHSELAGYKEEHDIQRAAMQQLSAQVVKMQRVVDNARFLLILNQNGCMSQVGESELAQALVTLKEGEQ